MTTSELAEKIGILATSIHQRVSRTGSYFGIRPQPLLNGRLIWPDDALEQLSGTQRRRAPAAKGADHAPA